MNDKNWISTKTKFHFDENVDDPFDLKPLAPSNNESIKTDHSHPSEIMSLTDEQERVVETVLEGKNVFFTGCAGTGKSTILRAIISLLPWAGTFVTASTGIAAVNVGGITLHSWAGIGRGEGNVPELVEYPKMYN